MFRRLFPALRLDGTPMERAIFDSSSNCMTIEVDTEEDERVTIRFSAVVSFSYLPPAYYDMKQFCEDDEFISTLYRACSSNDLTSDVYFLPTYDGVWRIDASSEPTVERVSK